MHHLLKHKTIVSCVVTTDLGYQDVCQYEVLVTNPMANQVICPEPLTLVTEPGALGMVVDLPSPTFNNDCPIEWHYSITADSFLDCGQHTITAMAIDQILTDTSFCTFDITIECPPLDTCSLLNTMITVDATSNDSCCFFVSLENNFESMQGGQLKLTLAGTDEFEQWSTISGWEINRDSINPRELTIYPTSNQIPVGLYPNVARICGVLYEGGPNTIQLEWQTEEDLTLCAQQMPIACRPVRCCPGQSIFQNRASNVLVDLIATDCQANISVGGLGRCDENVH